MFLGYQIITFFLFVQFSTVSCDSFYIVTSPSSPCPGEYIGVPCLTLQQYASNPSQSQNITLLVEPGMYNLSTILMVSNGYNFTMSSTNATVTCTSATAQFEFNTVENVHISGITFQGCGNTVIRMLQVTSASIVSSNFTDNQALSGSSRHGGCLYITLSSVTISKSDFYNNRAYSAGGAIYAASSTVAINRSHFSLSRQTYYYGSGGGAIYASSSNITIDRSTFTHNYKAGLYGGGGAIYCSGILQVNNTMFVDNRAYNSRNGHGGAIYTAGINTSIILCQFLNNSAYGNGGGIYTAGLNSLITQCEFINNIANGIGGGLFYTGELNLSLIQCHIRA